MASGGSAAQWPCKNPIAVGRLLARVLQKHWYCFQPSPCSLICLSVSCSSFACHAFLALEKRHILSHPSMLSNYSLPLCRGDSFSAFAFETLPSSLCIPSRLNSAAPNNLPACDTKTVLLPRLSCLLRILRLPFPSDLGATRSGEYSSIFVQALRRVLSFLRLRTILPLIL